MGASALTVSTSAQPVVEIRIHGRFFTEPATVRITVAVEPDARNRTLVIMADSDQLFRSSELVLDGENGRRIHNLEFKNLPRGYYIVRAEVHSRADLRGAAEQPLVVGDQGERR